jgi:hypothetical protein
MRVGATFLTTSTGLPTGAEAVERAGAGRASDVSPSRTCAVLVAGPDPSEYAFRQGGFGTPDLGGSPKLPPIVIQVRSRIHVREMEIPAVIDVQGPMCSANPKGGRDVPWPTQCRYGPGYPSPAARL